MRAYILRDVNFRTFRDRVLDRSHRRQYLLILLQGRVTTRNELLDNALNLVGFWALPEL